jgi:hypothetical protein
MILGTSIGAFGVLHFLYPAFAPGIHPMFTTVRFFVPGHLFWVYLSAIMLLLAGAGSILIDRGVISAATVLGLVFVLFGLLTWRPPLFSTLRQWWDQLHDWHSRLGLFQRPHDLESVSRRTPLSVSTSCSGESPFQKESDGNPAQQNQVEQEIGQSK